MKNIRLFVRPANPYTSRPRGFSISALCADLAQLVEHLIRNEGVGGSNPSIGKFLDLGSARIYQSFPLWCSLQILDTQLAAKSAGLDRSGLSLQKPDIAIQSPLLIRKLTAVGRRHSPTFSAVQLMTQYRYIAVEADMQKY